jgi:hypothetical protein
VIIGHHALLVLAVCAIALAGWGLAARSAPLGAERILAAATYATALVVLETLALGLVGLGASPVALTVAAVLSWLAARMPGRRVHIGAVAAAGLGVAAVVGVWQLRYPAVGVDGAAYHLPEVAQWVASGHVGTVLTVSSQFPTGSYPLVNEIVLTWGTAIGRSWVFQTFWAPGTYVLAAVAGWTGLRALGVPPLRAALAVAAVLLVPDAVRPLNTPKNDLPALAWLVTSGALAARGRTAPAILAAGLAVGTKTTTAPLAALVLVLSVRPPLRPLLWPAVAAAVLGGLWYVRNTIQHGWPVWPISSGPTGDPIPETMSRIHVSMLQRPSETLTSARLSTYADLIAGGLVLFGGGILAWFACRRRSVAIASVATLASVLLYAAAPYTGNIGDPLLDLSLVTTRYLLPAMACGAVALALAGRIGTLLLAGSIVWSLARDATFGYPYYPGAGTVLAGAVAGVAAAAVIRRVPRLSLALGLPAAAVALGLAAPGWLGRVGNVANQSTAGLERWFDARPGFADGHEPVAMAPVVDGPLAGDRVTHDVRLIPSDEPCAAVLERMRKGWLVVRFGGFDYLLPAHTAPGCLAGVRPLATVGEWRIYRQIATRSSAASGSPARSSKSSGVIAAASGSSSRRWRLSSAS